MSKKSKVVQLRPASEPLQAEKPLRMSERKLSTKEIFRDPEPWLETHPAWVNHTSCLDVVLSVRQFRFLDELYRTGNICRETHGERLDFRRWIDHRHGTLATLYLSLEGHPAIVPGQLNCDLEEELELQGFICKHEDGRIRITWYGMVARNIAHRMLYLRAVVK